MAHTKISSSKISIFDFVYDQFTTCDANIVPHYLGRDRMQNSRARAPHGESPMPQTDAAPRFNVSLIFPDVDAATLAHEDLGIQTSGAAVMAPDAWRDYLRRVLPPLPRRAGLRVLRGDVL